MLLLNIKVKTTYGKSNGTIRFDIEWPDMYSIWITYNNEYDMMLSDNNSSKFQLITEDSK